MMKTKTIVIHNVFQTLWAAGSFICRPACSAANETVAAVAAGLKYRKLQRWPLARFKLA
jgi:hypothetical protein